MKHFRTVINEHVLKPVDIIRETYEPGHYKDLNKARPALKPKIEAFKIPNHL